MTSGLMVFPSAVRGRGKTFVLRLPDTPRNRFCAKTLSTFCMNVPPYIRTKEGAPGYFEGDNRRSDLVKGTEGDVVKGKGGKSTLDSSEWLR